MDISEYLEFIGKRIRAATDNGDKAEVLRLLYLLGETVADQITKIEECG